MWQKDNKDDVFCVLFLPGALMFPEYWDPAVVPNSVRGRRATCRLTPWESLLYQAASPPQAQLWRTASGFPGSSWPARKIARSRLAPPATPLESPYMIFPRWKTHSSQRLSSQQPWTWLFFFHDHKLCGDWMFVWVPLMVYATWANMACALFMSEITQCEQNGTRQNGSEERGKTVNASTSSFFLLLLIVVVLVLKSVFRYKCVLSFSAVAYFLIFENKIKNLGSEDCRCWSAIPPKCG